MYENPVSARLLVGQVKSPNGPTKMRQQKSPLHTMEQIRHFVETLNFSRTTILVLIVYTNTLDNILLTSVVPIIPEVMMEIDKNEEYVKGGNDSISLDTASGDRNVSLTFTKQLLRESYKAVDENSQVGFLLSSKALIQIIANPCVGFLSERCGYHLLLVVGTSLLIITSLVYTCAGSFATFLAGRLVQGIASAFCSIAGMSILAELYQSDLERSKVMGVAMGGVALGVVVGYPFGGFLYAFCGQSTPFFIVSIFIIIDLVFQVCIICKSNWMPVSAKQKSTSLIALLKDPLILITSGIIMVTTMAMSTLEPIVPIWVIDTMKAPKWQLGLIFLPDSIGYLIGTNFLGVIAMQIGRWLCSLSCMILIGFCVICIPFSTSVPQLILPHFGIGLGLGIVDAALMPLLALLVDTRHVTSYGSIYTIAQLSVSLAYGIGPLLGGELVKLVGFQSLMWSLGCLLVLVSPCAIFLRSMKTKEENMSLILNTEEEALHRELTSEYRRLYTEN
ncbi:synaptic vesicular amine transporter-like [Ostrea edulis]|uniref:synaptic vesicular amine transporter-like n=1 Tax=Ostrea edulis TaxID=37623 RepID=UPI0024AFDC8B|nr:synaptic vesicular amine transporter-like [Ostrea edulis]